jgi:hypothetical protein
MADEGHWRSSVSRSYYAAYCAVTSELVGRGVSFPHGRKNPGHEQLPNLVLHNLTLPMNVRRQLKRWINFFAKRGRRRIIDPGEPLTGRKL